jgi:hypothetical protein
VQKDAQGDFRINPGVLVEFNRLAGMAFSDSFRARTLILLVYNAPYFVPKRKTAAAIRALL